jgi:hypothetical protein
VFLAQASPQAAKVVPDRVAVQDPTLSGVGAGPDRGGDPAFQGDEAFVAGRQGAGGDQDAAQVGEGLAGGELVEDLVG